MVGRKSGVNVPRHAVLADDNTCMLDRVVGKQELAPDNACLRMALCVVHQCIQPPGLRESCRCSRKQNTRRCGGGAGIAGFGETPELASCRNELNLFAVTGQQLPRGIFRRAIVDDDDFRCYGGRKA